MNVSPDIGYLDTSVGRHVELIGGGPRPHTQFGAIGSIIYLGTA